MNRARAFRIRWLGFAAVLAYVPLVQAQVAPPPEPEALYATPTKLDRVGRVLAPVIINGQGPFRFVVDTGANRSALSAALAEQLGLPREGAAMIGVHGVTGFAELPAVRVASLRTGNIELLEHQMPVLPGSVFADADGILGVEGLQDARIEVDFEYDRVTVQRSTRKRAPSGYLVVPAQLERGGLLLVSGRVGRIRVRVIVDTGAERSIGNLRLREALEQTLRKGDWVESIVSGATPGDIAADAFRSPPISIGEARLTGLTVTFGDLHVFRVWGLTEEPALLVGMDIIGTLERLVVDYGRREFQFKSRTRQQPSVEMCGRTGCGSRLPPQPGT